MKADLILGVIQALAAIASVLVAYFAVRVARSAKSVASESVQVARESVATSRRQVALSAVPVLMIERLEPGMNTPILGVRVRNIGQIPAMHIGVEVQTDWDADPDSRWFSSRLDILAAGPGERIEVPIEGLRTTRDPDAPKTRTNDEWKVDALTWLHPTLWIVLDFFGPQGAYVIYKFQWNTDADERYLRNIEIKLGDGGDPISVGLA